MEMPIMPGRGAFTTVPSKTCPEPSAGSGASNSLGCCHDEGVPELSAGSPPQGHRGFVRPNPVRAAVES
jgi:hypothetical protein